MTSDSKELEQLESFCQEIMNATNCSERELAEFVEFLTNNANDIPQNDAQVS